MKMPGMQAAQWGKKRAGVVCAGFGENTRDAGSAGRVRNVQAWLAAGFDENARDAGGAGRVRNVQIADIGRACRKGNTRTGERV